jgi:hypothetical protein
MRLGEGQTLVNFSKVAHEESEASTAEGAEPTDAQATPDAEVTPAENVTEKGEPTEE